MSKAKQNGHDDDEGMPQRFGIELPYTMTLRIRGVRPFLFNRMDIEAYDAEGGPGAKRKPRARPEYESMIWRDDDGVLALPVLNVIGSICAAGKYFRSPIAGNGSATPTLREGVQPGVEFGSFGVKSWDCVDFRKARHGDRARTPKPTYRPRLETGWCLEVQLAVVTPELYGPTKLLEVVNRAGQVMGVGDGRAIGFGRYVVDSHSEADGVPW
jgi:hypothetical protein